LPAFQLQVRTAAAQLPAATSIAAAAAASRACQHCSMMCC
jgi:hypothetical protein